MPLIPSIHILHEAWRDRTVRWFALLGLIVVALVWTWAIMNQPQHKALVPIHYTIFFGIDLTGRPWQWYLRPAVATAIWIINAALALSVKSTMWTRAWLLLGLGICVLLGLSGVALQYSLTR